MKIGIPRLYAPKITFRATDNLHNIAKVLTDVEDVEWRHCSNFMIICSEISKLLFPVIAFIPDKFSWFDF